MANPLSLRPHWFVPLKTIVLPGALTSSMRSCLPGSAAVRQMAPVLVFEDAIDAQKYHDGFRESAQSEGVLVEEHEIHKLTWSQASDVFMIAPRHKGDVMFIPVPVFHDDAQEVIDKLRKEGPSAASEVATNKAVQRALQMR